VGFVKIGYFRIEKPDSETYVSYDEFRQWDAGARERLRERAQRGEIKLYCACRADFANPLTITQTGVIRVANNGNQDNHAESCPKSEVYAGWTAQSKKGVIPLYEGDGVADGRLCFNFSLPPLFKSKSTPSASSGSGTGIPREKKMALYDLVTTVNRIAWLHQTYSIKKKIGQARKEGKDPEWEWKDLDEFNRLFFGTCNDVYVHFSGQTLPLYALCYKQQTFAQCMDQNMQFFIYAVVEKASPFKAGRKYQYVTLRMASEGSRDKAVVRIPTEDYPELFPENLGDGRIRVLSGFVRKITYRKEDGGADSWITLVRGVVITVTKNGLWYENDAARSAISELCRRKVLFYRPYLPLENFGSEVPTIQIDRWKDKTLLIDCPDPALADVHAAYGKDNEEFEIKVIREGEDARTAISSVLPKG